MQQINILTRYSRPQDLKRTVESLNNQTYKNINHLISYESQEQLNLVKDLNFLPNTTFIKVSKLTQIDNLKMYYHHHDYYTDYLNFDINKDAKYIYGDLDISQILHHKYKAVEFRKNNRWCLTLDYSIVAVCLHFPANLYLKTLGDNVKEGWIFYLDNGDVFETFDALEKLVNEINTHDEDTLHLFKLMNRGRQWTTPRSNYWDVHLNLGHPSIMGEASGSCICFHSKWKSYVKWGEWRMDDYRTIRSLESIIPKRNLFNEIIIHTP